MKKGLFKVPLHAGMGEAVIRRLQEFTPLPPAGFVAGQSVASALSQEFGFGKAVRYNDVDLFRLIDFGAETRYVRYLRVTKSVLQTRQFVAVSVDQDYSQLTFRRQGAYSVAKTSRDGMLNVVDCLSMDCPKTMLSTFDLNCVQCGVDLETKSLIWTPQFEKFARSCQLECVTLQTPFHSLIRFFRKLRELDGIYANVDRMVEMVGAAALFTSPDPSAYVSGLSDSVSASWRFGEAMKSKLDEVASSIEPHFDLLTETVAGREVYLLKPRFEIEADMASHIYRLCRNDLAPVESLPYLSAAMREGHRPGLKKRLHQVTLDRSPSQGAGYVEGWVLSRGGIDSLQGNLAAGELALLEREVGSHLMADRLVGHDLKTQVEIIKRLRRIAARRGMWIYGLLEATRDHIDLLSDAALDAALDAAEEGKKGEIAERLLPDMPFGAYAARELVSNIDLENEGCAMRHCVRGFAGAVKAGDCRIISFRKGEHASEWLTMEVRRQGLRHYARQLRGLQNRQPTPEEVEMARRYVNVMDFALFVGPRAAIWLRDMPKTRAVAEAVLGVASSAWLAVAKRAQAMPQKWLWFRWLLRHRLGFIKRAWFPE